VVKQLYSLQQVEYLMQLVKKGDSLSLTQLRQELGKTQMEIATKIGVSEHQLGKWEKGEQQPSGRYFAQWRLKLSYYVDDVISDFLGTEDVEIVTRYWELMWRLID